MEFLVDILQLNSSIAVCIFVADEHPVVTIDAMTHPNMVEMAMMLPWLSNIF